MDIVLLIAAAVVAWELLKPRSAGAAVAASGASSNYGLPSNLPLAVAQVESGGRQYDSAGNVIMSPAGAIGMMQLMPGTAADLGVDPYDASQNFAGGSEYLNQLYAQYGNVPDTLAAYNWGPGNVNRALANGTPYPSSVQGYIASVEAALANL